MQCPMHIFRWTNVVSFSSPWHSLASFWSNFMPLMPLNKRMKASVLTNLLNLFSLASHPILFVHRDVTFSCSSSDHSCELISGWHFLQHTFFYDVKKEEDEEEENYVAHWCRRSEIRQWHLIETGMINYSACVMNNWGFQIQTKLLLLKLVSKHSYASMS